MLLAWLTAPLPTFAAFLACSTWHFGAEGAAPGRAVPALRGGLPIAAPVLLQPEATARVLGAVAGVSLAQAVAWAAFLLLRGRERDLMEPVLFAAMPPLTAFAIYFACVHALRHVAGLAVLTAPHLLPDVLAWRAERSRH